MSGGWSRFTRGQSSYDEMNAGCNTFLIGVIILIIGALALGGWLGSFDPPQARPTKDMERG